MNTSTSPKVQYSYTSGSANTSRSTGITYPNGRVVSYDYGTANGINDAISRVDAVKEGATALAQYSYLGGSAFVITDYTEPDIKWTLADLAGSNDPDTGDIYSGFDRFGRGKDCRWRNYGNNTDTVRLKYGYDRASNRLWRADLVAQSLSKDFDELYSYDGLHRLKDMQRGLLNGSNTVVTNQTFGQCWSLDPTSNWHGFKEAATGGSWTLDQSRSANTVNEITGITNWTGPTWTTPAYDTAGNTITIPQPADPTESYTGTYDAWNRQVKLTDDSTDDAVQENQYDARTFRTVRKDYNAGVLAETRHFYFTSGWQGIEERLGSSPNSADAERQFVWGQRYIDDLVLRDRDTGDDGTLDERLYGLQDANWNMVALIDSSDTAQERYLYSSFGWPIVFDGTMSTIRTSSNFDFECLFTGQPFDWKSRTSLFRMRPLDAICGRFMTRDPLMYPDGASSYAAWFAPNSHDPLGLFKGPHHWFPQSLKWMLDFLDCDGFDIDSFTTDLGEARHKWLHGRGYNWNDKVKDVFDESSDCCSFLQGIIELAANAAAALAKEFGDPTIGTFTLIDFNNRFRNTNHKFNDYVDYVCKNRKPKKCRKPRTVTRPETAIEPLPFYSGFLPGVEWDRTIDSVVIGGGIIGGTFLGGAGAYFIIVRVGGVVVFQGKAAAGAIGGILNWIRTVFGPGAGVRILPL